METYIYVINTHFQIGWVQNQTAEWGCADVIADGPSRFPASILERSGWLEA